MRKQICVGIITSQLWKKFMFQICYATSEIIIYYTFIQSWLKGRSKTLQPWKWKNTNLAILSTDWGFDKTLQQFIKTFNSCL